VAAAAVATATVATATVTATVPAATVATTAVTAATVTTATVTATAVAAAAVAASAVADVAKVLPAPARRVRSPRSRARVRRWVVRPSCNTVVRSVRRSPFRLRLRRLLAHLLARERA
jgi:hypothetical protein